MRESTPNKTAGTVRSKSTRQKDPFVLRFYMHPKMEIVGNGKSFPIFQAETVKTFNSRFVSILDDVRRRMLSDGTIDFRGRNYDYLARFSDAGAAAYQRFWSPEARTHFAVTESEKSERGISFTFQVDATLSVYWEMLYKGDPRKPPVISDFWGFSFPIGRCFIDIQPEDRVELQNGMFSAIHNKLTLSRQEVKDIRSYLAALNSSSLKMLDDALKSETPTVGDVLDLFHEDDFGFGLVHFACHCDVAKDLLETSLRLTSRGQEIELILEKMVAYGDYGFPNKPLVFLNACQTADVEGLRAGLAFSEAVLKFGAAGVIATACIVPDIFAGAFAKEFYRRLLTSQASSDTVNVASVLMETRRHFIEKFENPMGLAYGLYAESDQKFQV